MLIGVQSGRQNDTKCQLVLTLLISLFALLTIQLLNALHSLSSPLYSSDGAPPITHFRSRHELVAQMFFTHVFEVSIAQQVLKMGLDIESKSY